MLFDVWGSDTLIHWAGWAMVFIGLIVLNEVGRRTKLGAAIIFGVAPLAMTIYCVAIAIGVSQAPSGRSPTPPMCTRTAGSTTPRYTRRWPAAGASLPLSTSGARSVRRIGSARGRL